ncbi:cell division protein FtsA [Candidatus Anaplasma sp. TIGMIC]|uniref:cell division protein FtsA n=1 Tax=Candidatus Anaplasma sp. TIGMIC TaxID=3020713 RepID=UPI00232AD0E7|nr:cell division protein FtsA [Candidatus Anaplasma sp. TIGMIC]MDB1135301.1 cell division protein FtsA [Candidatus Anaplasma sp. TIGMIC]
MLHSAVITEPKRGVFAVLDMGSTKIACLAVRINSEGFPEVIGVGYRASNGISGGAITNKHDAGCAILSGIDLAEQVSAQTISQVYVSVSGCGIKSVNVSNDVVSDVREISERDIKRVTLKTYDRFSGDDIVIHNVPMAYHLDSLSNVSELSGLYGSKLCADMHVVTVSKPALINVEQCITGNNLIMGGCVAEPYVSGLSCLTEDERELGTMVVDVGGNYTSMGFFYKGKFERADSIPFGGVHITRDVAYGLCTSVKDAERIKILHGSAICSAADKNYSVEVDDIDGASKFVSKADIACIIRPRVEEIFEFVKSRMDDHRNIVSKVVLTGGGSKLAGIKEVAGEMLGRHVRVGYPFHVKGMQPEYCGKPEFAAAVGTVMLVARTFYRRSSDRTPPRVHGNLERLLRWLITKVEA